MSKAQKIKDFVVKKITEIDQQYENTNDNMEKLKYSTMRTSFANILNTYLSEQGELGVSYFKHSQTYMRVSCYEQAIFYAELAKKHLRQPDILEDAIIINLNCLLKSNRIDEAHDLIKNLVPKFRKMQFLEIKAEIMQKIKNEDQTFECMVELEKIIEESYTKKSVQMGLLLIQKGRKKGVFNRFEQALKLMQEGMNILIDVRYKDQPQIGKIYLQMAGFSRELKNLDSEYSYLVCAHSMLRQLPNKQKEMVQTLHKIAKNLFERDQYQGSLKELLKIEIFQKQIYGQSSLVVGKTIKKICDVLIKMNRRAEGKKYELQYSRIIGCNDRKGMVRQKPLKFSQVKGQN